MKYDVDSFFSNSCAESFFFDNSYEYVRVGYTDQWRVKDDDFQYEVSVFALLLDDNGKLPNAKELIYYHNMMNKDKTALRVGECDSQAGCRLATGEMRCSDNDIDINLRDMSPAIRRILFIVNVDDCSCKEKKNLWGNQCYLYLRKQEALDSCRGKITVGGQVEWTGHKHDERIGVLCELSRAKDGWMFNTVLKSTSENDLGSYLNSYSYTPLFT